MSLLNSTYSLQQGFYAAGVFPAPLPNYSGFSVVAGLRMQPPFGALSTAAAMGQLATFPGGSAAAIAAAASFGMEHLRTAQGLRPTTTSERAASPNSPPGSDGDKRSGVTDFSIDGILGHRDVGGRASVKVTSSSSSIRVKHKLGVNCNKSSHQSYQLQNKTLVLAAPKASLDNQDHETAASKMTDEDDENHDDSKPDSDSADNPMARFSWLQCTRYKPPRLPRTKRKDGAKKRKLGRNPRVPFSPTQVATLEQKFRCTHYLSSIDVAELSAALNLSENRVKIWFQNRRARERRDKEGNGVDPKSQQSCASTTTTTTTNTTIINNNNNLLTPGPSPVHAPLSHSPHTPLSPLSSSSSSASPSSASSGMSIPPFTSPIGSSLTPSSSSCIAIARLSSPLMSIEGTSHASSSSSPSSLSSPSSFPASHHHGVVSAERSPTPTGHHSHHHQQHYQQQHHHSPLSAGSSDPSVGSAFTLVPPSSLK